MNKPEHPKVGVCILRVESQPGHLLITMTTNRHLDSDLHSSRPEQTQHFSDPDVATQAVAEFLRLFQ